MSESFDILLSRLTPYARLAVLSHAHRHMRAIKHRSIGAEHLLLGIMSVTPQSGETNPVSSMLAQQFDVSLYSLREAVAAKPQLLDTELVDDLFTKSAVKALELAGVQAYRDQNRDGCITRFNIGLGLGEGGSPAVLRVLKEVGIDQDAFVASMRESNNLAVRP